MTSKSGDAPRMPETPQPPLFDASKDSATERTSAAECPFRGRSRYGLSIARLRYRASSIGWTRKCRTIGLLVPP